jgi:hypothetical protein
VNKSLAAAKGEEFRSCEAQEEGGRMPELCKVFPFVELREDKRAEELGEGNKEDGPQGGMCI